MSKLSVVAAAIAVTLAVMGRAHADEAAGPSRAQVIAELQAARASGELGAMTAEDSGSARLTAALTGPGLTRAEVIAEVIAARARGELDALFGEDSGSMHLAQRQPAAPPVIYAGQGPVAQRTGPR